METSLENQLATARTELGSIPENIRHLYTNGAEVQNLYNQARNTALVRLQMDSHGTPTATANAAGRVVDEIRGAAMSNLGNLHALTLALDSSEEYAEAVATIQPLVDKIARLETKIADHHRAEQTEANRKAEAKQKALDEAAAKIEAEFADPEPEAPQEPAPPFRGKGIKPALATA